MDEVLYETRGGVALVTINREQRRNALDLRACDALMECWQRIENDDSVYVGVVTGAGDKAFCAGFDFKEKLVDGRPNLEDFSPRLGTTCSVTKPLIAAVNGPAVAAGMALVEACDLCVAAEDAWFALSEVTLGISVENFVQSLWNMPQKILMELLVTGEPLSARRAYDLGFVNRIVPRGALLEAAFAMADLIAANAPLVVRASKQMVYDGQAAMGMERALEVAAEAFQVVNDSADAKEGFVARAEGRPPVWRGA
jgi:enoyl-CoA hydratase/carnithine racemase